MRHRLWHRQDLSLSLELFRYFSQKSGISGTEEATTITIRGGGWRRREGGGNRRIKSDQKWISNG